MTQTPSIPLHHSPPVSIRYYAGETGWAIPLGGDLYSITNHPLEASALRFGDIVRVENGCVAEIVYRPMTLGGAVKLADENQAADACRVLRESGLWTERMVGPYVYFSGLRTVDPRKQLEDAGVALEDAWDADAHDDVECERTACDKKLPATHRHRDTGRRYCHVCAHRINEACHDDAMVVPVTPPPIPVPGRDIDGLVKLVRDLEGFLITATAYDLPEAWRNDAAGFAAEAQAKLAEWPAPSPA